MRKHFRLARLVYLWLRDSILHIRVITHLCSNAEATNPPDNVTFMQLINIHFLGWPRQCRFVFPAHLVHALGVEAHDGGVGELVEHHPEDGGAVQRLVTQEQLLHEAAVQHRRRDVVQH